MQNRNDNTQKTTQKNTTENMSQNTAKKHGRIWAAWGLILTMMACLMAGCGAEAATDSAYTGAMNSSSQESYDVKYEYSVEMEGDMALGDLVESPSTGNASSGTTSTDSSLQAVSSRKLITTVTMETETEHYDDLMTWLNARIAEYGGYVEFSENYGNQSSRRNASLTIRIPAANLETFLTGLSQESNVTYQSRSVKDVTLNYVDVQSHKEALLVEQERLMELLEKANNLQDLLTIEERLTQVRYELESYESQLRTYDNQIDYSTIHLSIREVKVLTTPEPEGFWERVTSGFNDNLEDVTEGLVEFAIGFLSNIPTLIVWAVILVIVGLLLRMLGRIRRKRALRRAESRGESANEKKQTSKKRWGKDRKGTDQKGESLREAAKPEADWEAKKEVGSRPAAESTSYMYTYAQPEEKDGE